MPTVTDSVCPNCWHNFVPRKAGQECCSVGCANQLRAKRTAVRRAAKLAGRRKPGSKTRYRKEAGRPRHRKRAEELLGRKLRPGEEVHHLDGDHDNDDPYNLIVMSSHGAHERLGHGGGGSRGKDGRYQKR